MPPIAIVGVKHELAKLERRVAVARSQETPWGRLVIGRWQTSDTEIALAAVAAGKIGAAMGAQAVIDAVQPRLLLSCGSAGALAAGLHVGDIVVGDPVAVHDQGVFLPAEMARRRDDHRPDGFLAVWSALPSGRRRSFRPASTLLNQAKLAAERSGLAGLHVGPVVTGDQVILQDAARQWLHRTFAALAVDTESAAVAHVAHCHGLPWLVVRGISDAANSAIAFDYTPLLAYEEDALPGRWGQVSQLINLALADPAAARRIQRFRRGVQQALAAVVTLLDSLLPLLAFSGGTGNASHHA